MCIPIPSVTKEQFEDTSAKAGLRTFPFVSGEWKSFTASVTAIDILHGRNVDFLIVKGRNSQYGIRLSCQLDPTYVSPGYNSDIEERIEKNTDRLLKILKAFDLATFEGDGVWVEPAKFDSAIGKTFSFSIIGAMQDGQPIMTDRGIQKVYTAFRGLTPMLLPVTDSATEGQPLTGCATNSPTFCPAEDGFVPF